jgi:hypothetical protein
MREIEYLNFDEYIGESSGINFPNDNNTFTDYIECLHYLINSEYCFLNYNYHNEITNDQYVKNPILIENGNYKFKIPICGDIIYNII